VDVSLTGRLLVALPALDDPNFERTVVLLLDHDEDGALGVVLNRASEVPVHEALVDWADLAAKPPVVFGGGPVEPTAVVALGRTPVHVVPEGWEPLLERVRLVDVSADPVATEVDEVRVFAGYAGWGPGQLEGELDMGAWATVDARPEDVFTATPDELWSRVLARQSGPLRLLATFPDDPSTN
jgi:putative transcriptional regulator